jgi:hypothetical protein
MGSLCGVGVLEEAVVFIEEGCVSGCKKKKSEELISVVASCKGEVES